MTTTTVNASPRRNRRVKPAKVLWGILGILVALVWVFPVYWMVNSAFLPAVVLERTVPTLTPFGGSWKNFVSVLSRGSFQQALGISVAVALVTVTVCLIFAFLAALAISRFRFRGRKSFILAVLLIQMLPAEGLFIAQYRLVKSLGENVSPVIGLNSILGLSLIYTAAVIPFTIWMLRGFLTSSASRQTDWGEVMAASTLVAVPVIIFFLLVQGRMTSGLVSGAVKG